MDAKRTKVFLVDDYPTMRESLRKLLEYEPDFAVCGEAGDVQQAVEGIQKTRPDVAVVDLILGRQTGLEVLGQLKAAGVSTPVLILSMLPESLNVELALKKGARGYLMKSEPPEQILQALRRVRSGKIYLSPEMEAKYAPNGDPA